MKTVLIIEDEVQTRNIFLKCLAFEGFRAVGAADGSSGLEMAQRYQPDLVVCDIMMPDMDGYSVLSALRQREQTASIPLIFLTAKVTMAELRRGMELGADDYLTKPCSIDQFLGAVSVRLQRQAQLERLYAGQPIERASPTRPQPGPADREVNHGAQLEAIAPSSFPGSPLDPAPGSSIFPPDPQLGCPQLAAVFRFIECHFSEAIQLDDVAREVGYSSAYLTTLMQEQTGHSVKQWIIERRMAQARQLLVHSHQSIRQIAQASGYGDAGYFSRQFRKFHGASPQAWREASVATATN